MIILLCPKFCNDILSMHVLSFFFNWTKKLFRNWIEYFLLNTLCVYKHFIYMHLYGWENVANLVKFMFNCFTRRSSQNLSETPSVTHLPFAPKIVSLGECLLYTIQYRVLFWSYKITRNNFQGRTKWGLCVFPLRRAVFCIDLMMASKRRWTATMKITEKYNYSKSTHQLLIQWYSLFIMIC